MRIGEKRYPKRVSDICQDGWKKHMLLEKDIFLKHAENSARDAYQKCDGYFEQIGEQYGFSKNEMMVLAKYIHSRHLPRSHQKSIVRGEEIQDLDILKTVLDVLQAHKGINHALTVTPALYDQFQKDLAALK